MRIWKFLQCIAGDGHSWTPSHSRRGYETCVHCRIRRPLAARQQRDGG